MSNLHNNKIVKTRKDHKCEGCFEIIPQGTDTQHCKGIWEGDFYDYYFCKECDEYFDRNPDALEYGFTPGEVKNYRQE